MKSGKSGKSIKFSPISDFFRDEIGEISPPPPLKSGKISPIFIFSPPKSGGKKIPAKMEDRVEGRDVVKGKLFVERGARRWE